MSENKLPTAVEHSRGKTWGIHNVPRKTFDALPLKEHTSGATAVVEDRDHSAQGWTERGSHLVLRGTTRGDLVKFDMNKPRRGGDTP